MGRPIDAGLARKGDGGEGKGEEREGRKEQNTEARECWRLRRGFERARRKKKDLDKKGQPPRERRGFGPLFSG